MTASFAVVEISHDLSAVTSAVVSAVMTPDSDGDVSRLQPVVRATNVPSTARIASLLLMIFSRSPMGRRRAKKAGMLPVHAARSEARAQGALSRGEGDSAPVLHRGSGARPARRRP